jgi:hypothetical protein
MNERLKLVRLQYRSVSGGEWITAKDEGSPETDKKFNLLCADSRTEGCKFDWVVNNQFEKLLSGFKDNVYELRLKNFCFGGSSLADPSVHEYVGDQRLTLTVDTNPPVAASQIEFNAQTFGVDFDEAIDCSGQKVEITKIRADCGSSAKEIKEAVSAEDLRGTFRFKCVNNEGGFKWLVTFPNTQRGKYIVKVDGVTDVAGNAASSLSLIVDSHCADEGLAQTTASEGSAALGYAAPTVAKKREADASLLASPAVFVVLLASLALVAVLMRATTRRREQTDEEELNVLSKRSPSKTAPSYGATL